MPQEGFKRKLTAILSADVKEYSRLMSQDEVGTIRTLNAHREAISGFVQQYKGRVVDSTDNGVKGALITAEGINITAISLPNGYYKRGAAPSNRSLGLHGTWLSGDNRRKRNLH